MLLDNEAQSLDTELKLRVQTQRTKSRLPCVQLGAQARRLPKYLELKLSSDAGLGRTQKNPSERAPDPENLLLQEPSKSSGELPS